MLITKVIDRIQAIKLYKSCFKTTLKEAADAIPCFNMVPYALPNTYQYHPSWNYFLNNVKMYLDFDDANESLSKYSLDQLLAELTRRNYGVVLYVNTSRNC